MLLLLFFYLKTADSESLHKILNVSGLLVYAQIANKNLYEYMKLHMKYNNFKVFQTKINILVWTSS